MGKSEELTYHEKYGHRAMLAETEYLADTAYYINPVAKKLDQIRDKFREKMAESVRNIACSAETVL